VVGTSTEEGKPNGYIFITGSADGLGRAAPRKLIAGGREVVPHTKSEEWARDLRARTPSASALVIGDVASALETRSTAEQVNAFGWMDAVIV
jgi:NAD(P)-dependent dehydrogenase (short-subunit alcohol dehydrogenase family)